MVKLEKKDDNMAFGSFLSTF